MSPDPEIRKASAKYAALCKWGTVPDRSAATSAARSAFLSKLALQADPKGELSSEELALRVLTLRRAHMALMALGRAKSRASKRRAASGRTPEAAPSGEEGTPDAVQIAS